MRYQYHHGRNMLIGKGKYQFMGGNHEYVIGDMITPFKAVLGDVYREVEARLARAILQRFSIAPDPPAALARMTKQADRISAFFEATLYAGFDKHEAATLFGAPEIDLRRVENFLAPMLPEQAQAQFLEKFRTYEKGL
jgi:5'-deoxynucleotidase YfbR-like HD superfamily hydrolase